MRRSRTQMLAAVLMAAMLLGGCGEAAYELTEAEENIIANYSAHVVSKYNARQKSGLVYVSREQEETQAASEETETPEETGEFGTSNGESGALAEEGLVTDAAAASFSELFGQDGLTFAYAGAELVDSYMEDTYYAMYPDAGNAYLVLKIDITNAGDAPVTVDHLTDQADFSAVLNGDITASVESTLLTEDFSTFVGEIAAGDTKETVLLFQVPADTQSVDSLALFAGVAGMNYQITL